MLHPQPQLPLLPYPPEYPNPYDRDIDIVPNPHQSDAEKQICKLSKKASTLRALINNIEEKNKSVIVKSSTYSYNLGEYKTPDTEEPEIMNEDENIGSILEILKAELELIKAKIKELSDELGYASNMKDYKENPDNYKGSVADISTVIRVALTSSSMTPDLYEIMKLFSIERIKPRINKIIGE